MFLEYLTVSQQYEVNGTPQSAMATRDLQVSVERGNS